MTIAEFDHLDDSAKRLLFEKCCGSSNWINKMMACMPAEDLIDLFEYAEDNWYACSEEDWKEAFTHHPEIGNVSTLREKFASTADLASNEQSGVEGSSEEIIQQLAEGNRQYRDKFGYIFIISAAGKSAQEILKELQLRLPNPPEIEIDNAMEEQNKITKLRIEKLFV